jgi:multimeric flavodoxin WrbA
MLGAMEMILILWSSPNGGGLTAACAHAAEKGIAGAGGECRLYKLNDMGIGACRACGNGWGTCHEGHVCQVQDGFQALHEEVKKAEGLVAVTPVYWGDMSESAKNFFDRLRRCEATLKGKDHLGRKLMLAVAAAGGSGNGTLSCLTQMERLASHLGMRMFDGIPVKRFTRQYQLDTVECAAAAIVSAIKE